MTAAKKLHLVSVEDYLTGELSSTVKHEYLGGIVYAMAGGRNVNNMIKVNVLSRLRTRLRGSRCRPFDSDTKIRVQLPRQIRFYYPDASVICEPNAQEETFQDKPSALFEVLSRNTRRIDEGEKKEAFLTIPSLTVYILIEQDRAAATVHRRIEDGFASEVYEGLDAVIPLGEINVELPLSEVYDGVEFRPEPAEGDAAF